MSNVIEQKEAVFQAVTKVLKEANIVFEPGVTNVRAVMTRELRAQVNAILFEGFNNGTIVFRDTVANKAKLADPKELRNYISGLQSNYLTKHENFKIKA